MTDAKELGITPASAGTGTGAVSLGKGAWDCDANREIPPDKEVRLPRPHGRAPGAVPAGAQRARSRLIVQTSRHNCEGARPLAPALLHPASWRD